LNYKLKFGKPVKSILQLQDAFFVLGLVLIVFCNSSFGQNSFKNEKMTLQSLQYSISQDSLKKDTTVKEFRMTRSPLKAVLYSALVPGLGQYYNKSYWKIPVIWAFEGYFIYLIIRNNNKFIDYRDLYISSQTAANPNGDLRYKTLREFYRDQRDQFYLYAGLVYVINIFDAFVDAHLFDFDVSDYIKVRAISSSSKLINLNINF